MGKVQHRFTNLRYVSMKKAFVQKTHTCITEGGSLTVYAKEGEFVCPNCGPTTVDVNHDVNGKNVNVTLLLSNNLIARQPYGFYNTTHI